MIWILQNNLISEIQVNEIIYAFKEHCIPFEEVKVIPFSDEIEVQSDDPYKIPYGSTSLSNYAYKHNWGGIFFNENFRMSEWLNNRADLLNHDCHIYSVDEARHIMPMEEEREWFIRPDNDLKEFAGECMLTSQFNAWMDKMKGANGNLLNEKTQIVVAPAKEIPVEYRWFIVGGEVIDGSVYRINRRLFKKHVDDPDKIKQAQELADKWLPHETCVMDSTSDKVIEFNCLNSSGFYDHDIEKIIGAVDEFYRSKA